MAKLKNVHKLISQEMTTAAFTAELPFIVYFLLYLALSSLRVIELRGERSWVREVVIKCR